MKKLGNFAAPAAFIAFAATLAPWAWNFPLNDDWAYAQAAKTLAETGRLVLSDWGAATQLPHILYGAAFSTMFGFSFGTLRLANLLAAAAALFAFSKLLDRFEIGPFEKLAAALALALNPLFLVLGNSFMTDIHYLFWMLMSAYFYLKNLKDPGDRAALWLGGLCAAAAYLTRQLAVALPLAFTLALLFGGRRDKRAIAAAWAAPAAAMAGFYLWFRLAHGPTWASENYVGAATLAHLARPGAFLNDAAYRVLAALMETGLLLLPLAAGFAFGGGGAKEGRRKGYAAAGLTLAALAVFALLNGPLPYLENNLAGSGLGVLTLAGAALKPSGIFGSPLLWKLATAAAAVSAALLVRASWLALRAGDPALRFVALASALQLCVSLVGAKFFDRYLLTLLPWFAAAAVFAARGAKFSRPAAALALALCAAAGWAGMKDYLAWNSAKWELALRNSAVLAPGEIANGFDYDAWYNYQKNMAYLKSMKPLRMIGEWEWQKINTYKAVISFVPDPRLKVIDRIEYATPLSSRKGVLYLLSLPKSAS